MVELKVIQSAGSFISDHISVIPSSSIACCCSLHQARASWQGSMPGQIGVTCHHILRRRTTESVIDKIAIRSPKPGALRIFVRQIELNQRGTIEKETPGLAIRQHQGKGNRNIQVILE